MVQSCTIFNYYPAQGKRIGLLSIPHSGEEIPTEFKPFLLDDARILAEDVDFQANELVDIKKITSAGIDVIVANIHRTCVDLNRPPENAVLNWKSNSQGVQIVMNEPSEEQVSTLRETYYTPYFRALEDLITLHSSRPVAVIDFHSMPSTPTAYHLKQNPTQKQERPDFCISDLLGKSCITDYIDYIVTSFKNCGFDATSNDPYFGGYVTKYINQFETNNVQIETKRSIYMNEVDRTLLVKKVEELKPVITKIIIETIEKFSS